MAKITVQLTGGSPKVIEASNVSEALESLGLKGKTYTMTVNGEPAGSEHEFSDYEFVTLTEAIKGA